MQLITLTEHEMVALRGEPAEVIQAYICLRWRMDFETGLVGAATSLSWWALREDMHVDACQGRSRDDSGTPSEKSVRNKVDRLIRLGLVESRTSYRRLVFFLPMAHKGSVRLKKVGQTLGRQAGMTLVGPESLAVQGIDENYPQEVGSTQSAEVGHTSGIRVNPLYEQQQQRTELPVDNSAALPFSEISEWLKAAEKRRGKILAVSAADRHIKSWVCRGMDVEALEEAHALAVADRERYGSAAPISAGFLDVFVDRVLAKRKPWFATWSGVVSKGKALGLEQLPDEPPPAFKRRVFAAAGIDEDEVRRWQP